MLKQALKTLPEFFQQRAHVLRDGAIQTNNSTIQNSTIQTRGETGASILYVMTDCLRLTENPGLDVARLLAKQFKLPLQVVSVLPYTEETTERQLSFMLDGARHIKEVSAFSYNYFLHPAEHTKDLYRQLCHKPGAKAGLIILDTLKQSLHRGWLSVTTAPILTISGNMLFPGVQHCNSYGFFLRQIRSNHGFHNPYPEVDLPVLQNKKTLDSSFGQTLDYSSILNIDHRISLVPSRRGGEDVALKLWERLKDHLFLRYPKIKKHVFDDTGSSLLPYLDYGMLSPFQMLNDCYITGTTSATLFKTQFLIWHEYLYKKFSEAENTKEVDTIVAPWLRRQLETATTDLPALNQCITHAREQGLMLPHMVMQMQESISRTTFKKHWSEISAFLKEWTLNKFQLPLCTQAGEESLDQMHYKDINIYAGPIQRRKKVGIVGAGMAGITAARALEQSGYMVEVFEQQPKVGGRLAFADLEDHLLATGVPFFTANHVSFRREIAAWEELGLVRQWQPEIYYETPSTGLNFRRMPHIATPELLTHLTKGLAIAYNTPIGKIEAVTGGSRLYDAIGQNLGYFDQVIVSTPPQVTIELLKNVPVQLIPHMAWVFIVKFPKILPTDKDIIALDNNFLDYAIRLTNVPGYALHQTGEDYWALYSSAKLAQQKHLTINTDKKVILKALYSSFQKSLNVTANTPEIQGLYKWPQYYPVKPYGKPYMKANNCIIAGDWLLGKRIEDALRSGYAAAAHVRELH